VCATSQTPTNQGLNIPTTTLPDILSVQRDKMSRQMGPMRSTDEAGYLAVMRDLVDGGTAYFA